MYLFRQKGRKTWSVRWWQDGQKRSASTGCVDRLEAERVVLAMREAIERKRDRRRVEGLLSSIYADRRQTVGLAVADVAGEYLRRTPGETRYQKECVAPWRRFACWFAANRPNCSDVADVDAAACRAWAASLTGAPKTVTNTVMSAARVWRAVVGDRGLAADPWRGIRLSKRIEKPRRELTADECARLLAAATGEYRGALLFGLYTGLRYSDIVRLDWSQIADGAVRVAPHKTVRFGIRVAVPLHRKVLAWLGEPKASGLIFPGLAAAGRSRAARAAFRKLCERAGVLHEGVTFHSLRHTFVSNLARAGVPADVRMRLAGHSSAATHSGYTHDEEVQRAAVDRLD